MSHRWMTAALAASCASPLAVSTASADVDGGTDAGAGYCSLVDDPCCLDDGDDEAVAALAGCNGGFYSPAAPGEIGGECAFDPETAGSLGDCPGISACWPFPNWFGEYPAATGGECGLCLPRCAQLGGCPDGLNQDEGTYDFCSADCPAGMRCWVYDYADSVLGLCMADCEDDSDCASLECAKEWGVCVPRPQDCDWQTADAGVDAGSDDGGDETFNASGGADTGCQCRSVARTGRSVVALIEALLPL